MTRFPIRTTLPALGLILALGGCGSNEPASQGGGGAAPAEQAATGTAAPTGDARAEAESIFANRCVPCHGTRGAGDGPASAGLDPKPRNFQDHAWQQSVNDDHIARIIQYGGSAVGKSAAMPANPDLQDKQAVVTALVAYVRSLGN